MALYQERDESVGVLLRSCCEEQSELLSEIIKIRSRISNIERQIQSLGICWFGEKRKKKHRLKAELEILKVQLSSAQRSHDLLKSSSWFITRM